MDVFPFPIGLSKFGTNLKVIYGGLEVWGGSLYGRGIVIDFRPFKAVTSPLYSNLRVERGEGLGLSKGEGNQVDYRPNHLEIRGEGQTFSGLPSRSPFPVSLPCLFRSRPKGIHQLFDSKPLGSEWLGSILKLMIQD